MIVGWHERGSIKDKSLIKAISTDVNEMVEAGQLNHHVVETLPTNPDFLNRNTLLGGGIYEIKYDVSSLI